MRHFLILAVIAAGRLQASVNADTVPVHLELRTARIGGTLPLPKDGKPYPCAVLVGGTLSQLRDGDLRRPGVPERKAMPRLAESLSIAGFGSSRFDAVGHGESEGKARYRDLYAGDAEVLAEIYSYLRGRKECTRVIAVGESAGAFVASRAARAGKASYEVADDGFRDTAHLAHRKEELDFPPDGMFACVKHPALAVAGSRDWNVPAADAACVADALRMAGNQQVQSVLILVDLPADHPALGFARRVSSRFEEEFPRKK